MDVTPFLEPQIAPRAVFDHLEARAARPRFLIPTADGDWRAVTWGGFAALIRGMGSYLRALGLSSPDRAAIFANNRLEWISAALAIQAVGGVMVPIYPSNTAAQAAYIIAHSDARVVFVDGEPLLERLFAAWDRLGGVERFILLGDDLDPLALAARLRAGGKPAPPLIDLERRVIPWSRALHLGQLADREDPAAFLQTMRAVSLDQPGVMLYTSGTTGDPKGVPLTHRNVGVNASDWLRCNAPLLDEGMTDVLWLPMSHIFGFGEACLGNTLGFVSYLSDPYKVLDHVRGVRPEVLMSVPSVWEKLARAAHGADDPAARLRELTGGRLRFCLSGGAGLKLEIKQLYHDAGMLIIEGYGLTETSPTLTLNRPDDFRFDSVGKPLPSVELRLADDGEIQARGPNVFGGYHKEPDATAAAFTDDGWLKTGDLGRWTEDGFLQIIGRKKEILVTAGGKNVPPANIELQFKDDPWISNLVVYGDGKNYLVAAVWLHEEALAAALRDTLAADRDAAARALIQARLDAVNDTLARHETIKKFILLPGAPTVDNGLLTPSLKIKRKEVYARFGDLLEALY
jgi:long-chain acyl-CoA synthetase